jgi:predicted permease
VPGGCPHFDSPAAQIKGRVSRRMRDGEAIRALVIARAPCERAIMADQILTIVLPVFALIGIGYAAARIGLLDARIGDALGQFVFVIAIPVLIFRTLATSSLDGVSPWGFWIAYFTGVAITWALGTLVVRRGFGRDARAGVIGGISAGFANTVLVGIPLITSIYGEAGLVPLFVLISIHLPVMTVVCSVVMERAAVVDGTQEAKPLSAAFWLGSPAISSPIRSSSAFWLAACGALRGFR